MSQRNRIVIAAVALAGSLFLAAPAPSQAAGLRRTAVPAVDAVERLWSWLVGLWTDGASAPTAPWEKEGGMISPDGQPHAATPPPSSMAQDSGSIR